jgi:hypothetical protein
MMSHLHLRAVQVLRAFVAKQSPVKRDHLINQHLPFKRRLLPRATPSSQ